MRDRDPRTRRWRRTLAGGFVVSLLAHVALLLAFDVTPPPTETDEERDRDRAVADWETDALRVVQLREPADRASDAEAASSAAARDASAPAAPRLPASLVDASPGSEAAGRALARFASAGGISEAPPVADSVGRGSRPSGAGHAAQEVPPAVYDGRADFKATSRAAREAARSGRSPDLGGDAVAVSGRGPIAGPPDGRRGFSGGLSGGGSCGVPAAINRLWDGDLVVGR